MYSSPFLGRDELYQTKKRNSKFYLRQINSISIRSVIINKERDKFPTSTKGSTSSSWKKKNIFFQKIRYIYTPVSLDFFLFHIINKIGSKTKLCSILEQIESFKVFSKFQNNCSAKHCYLFSDKYMEAYFHMVLKLFHNSCFLPSSH